MIEHHPNCSPDYPEKPEGEVPQAVMQVEIETEADGLEVVLQCSDCGAFEIVKGEPDSGPMIELWRPE